MNQHGVTPITTQSLSGIPLRDALLAQVRTEVAALGSPVRMCVVQVGENPASSTYVRNKLAACERVGIHAERLHLRAEESESALHATIRALAQDAEIHAIIVQTPLPAGWNVREALDLVPAAKDIDGLSTAGAKLRREGARSALLPATPLGIFRLLAHAGVPIAGSTMAVIGKGMVVGAPLQFMLKAAGAHLISIDKDTLHPARLTREADVLIAAAGAPALVTEDWVKPGATVIDVGLTRVEGKLMGDVARLRVEGIASLLTPVPGGVGPLTVASILTNIVDATAMQMGHPRPVWQIPERHA